MLVYPHEYFSQALRDHFAIGAFNTSNLEVTQAIIAAAEHQGAPVIVQTSEGALTYAGLTALKAMIASLAAGVKVPVILHLDHGKSLETVKRCIEAGYTSVMIDASDKPLKENIALSRAVVEFAHKKRVWVEAELGTLLGIEGAKKMKEQDSDAALTNPAEVGQFVTKTGVDALAVSVGTIHGSFAGSEYIRFELLEKIKQEILATPLVLHGASGITNEELKRAISLNVCKVNIDTELRIAFDSAVREFLQKETDRVDPRDMLMAARSAVKAVTEAKIKILGSSGKAVH